MQPRLLLVHHTRHHFEVLLALLADLRDAFAVSVWSNHRTVWGRAELLDGLGAQLHAEGEQYDLALVLSAEQPVRDAGLAAILNTTRTARIWHRFQGDQGLLDLFLFPRAKNALLLHDNGLDLRRSPEPGGPLRFLVQGSIAKQLEHTVQRRDFESLALLAEQFPEHIFNVVGSGPEDQLAERPNIRRWLNLAERDFHAACANNDFILPLLKPTTHRGYFTAQFTSSILIGMAAGLLFAADKRLFELYPIAGIAYDGPRELPDAIRAAAALTPGDYAMRLAQQDAAAASARARNVAVVQSCLSDMADVKSSLHDKTS